MLVASKDLAPKDAYQLLISCIIPRPIAWVSTIDLNGISNLAPFSFYTGASGNPPALVLSVTKNPNGGPKDTLANILSTKEFVVNLAPLSQLEKINDSSEFLEHGVSEFEKFKIESSPSVVVKAPGVKASPAKMECRLLNTLVIGNENSGSTLVIGEVLYFNINDNILKNGRIDPKLADPVLRLGGLNWASLGEVFSLKRP